jgi:hypothetical protein
MDLIPEHEQLHIIKIGAFGIPRSVLVDVKNLERIHFHKETTYAPKWYKSCIWVPKEDKKLVYRDMSTGEVFTFSYKGVWSKEGLEHELLN